MSNEDTNLTWAREEAITVPIASQERRIAIRYLDWDRCKRKLRKVKEQVPRLHLVFSFLFGIAASSLFSIITLSANPQSQLPAWVSPLYVLLLLFSLATALVFVYVDHAMRKGKESVIDEIIEDMDSIEKTFPEVSGT
jgi:hypothetical protein